MVHCQAVKQYAHGHHGGEAVAELSVTTDDNALGANATFVVAVYLQFLYVPGQALALFPTIDLWSSFIPIQAPG